MRITDGQISFGAGDLVDHLACRYLTELNTQLAQGTLATPGDRDPMLDLLRQRGLAHELEYVSHLEESGRKITRIYGVGLSQEAVDKTLEAMSSGCEIIVQAALSEGVWGGRADVLHRVDVPSKLGDWSYEVIDTKLARETKCGAILQLSLYSDLAALHSGRAARVHVRGSPLDGIRAAVLSNGRLLGLLQAGQKLAGVRRRRERPRCELPRPETALRHLPLESEMRCPATKGRPSQPGRRNNEHSDGRAEGA